MNIGLNRDDVSGRMASVTYEYSKSGQIVARTANGVRQTYEYDAAGRLVKEGDKTYTYGYLDKVMSVTESDKTFTYTYHPDGQLASANYGASSESFTWDGLALIQRGDEHFLDEPHVGGGNPVVSSKGTSFFNDMLGTTVGAKSGAKYSVAVLSAFGETIEDGAVRSTPTPSTYTSFFTGKPNVAGLGHAFLMRNYRAGLGKWQTTDPMGYPDGWNALAYCNNGVTSAVDLWGCASVDVSSYFDLFRGYAATAASKGDRELLEKISSETSSIIGKSKHWSLGIGDYTVVVHDPTQIATGNKRYHNGHWEYEVAWYDYLYEYTANLDMVEVPDPITLSIRSTQDTSSVLGLVVTYGNLPGSWALATLGAGGCIYTNFFDCGTSVPFGLQFVRKCDENHKMIEAKRILAGRTWLPCKE